MPERRRAPRPAIVHRSSVTAQERTPTRRARFVVVGGMALAGLGLIVAGALLALAPAATPGASQGADDPSAAASDRAMPIEADTNHVGEGEPIEYAESPPTSGRHYTRTARYGVSETAIAPGNWVHNLEHGAIVLLFRCDLDCPSIAESIRTSVAPLIPASAFGSQKFLATPYADMESAFAVVAWGWILELDRLDAAEIVGFYRRHVDRGPENVP